ncbi:outer membrane protein [Chelatococcus reniformis]|nr:outer membrane beta-barrel protein [Chelatococcus reniformis]
MKKFLLAGVAAASLLTAGSAFAADLPSRKYAPVAPAVIVPVFTWTGFYVGVNAGYAWNTNNDNNAYGYGYPGYAGYGYYGDSGSDGGFAGGGQIGYNYQIGQFVIGAEADIQYADLGGKNNYGYGNQGMDWFGTVRARAGFAFDRALIYATGGFAYGGGGNNNSAYFGNNYGYGGAYYGGNGDNTATGWTVGGGLEYAFTDNITAKVEGLYVSLDRGNSDVYLPGAALATSYYSNGSKNNEFGVVRVGLNYKF